MEMTHLKKINYHLYLICFKKNKNLDFVQDVPFDTKNKNLIKLKQKNHNYSVWPKFYPTSCISVRRKFFTNFLKFLEKKKTPKLRN